MTDPARAFAAKVLRAYNAKRVLGDVEQQDAALASGLLDWVTMQAPCDLSCACDAYGHDFPTDCLRLTDAAKALLAEYPE